MTGSFLDTTVVVHMAEGLQLERLKGEAFVAAHQPAEAPVYALRELLAGRVRVICDAHNKLQASENIGEALLALLSLSPAEGRKRESKIQALSQSLAEAFIKNPTGERNDLKREILQDLALKVARLWNKAHKISGVSIVQSLACFNDGDLAFGRAGELRGPGDSFNCIKEERCAAAAYIYDNKNNLVQMIAALHPNNLPPVVANKKENQQRRKALKDLQANGPSKFNKSLCRAIGDAYFAAMCPAGSVVATSNLVDHLPLCLSLGKVAKEP